MAKEEGSRRHGGTLTDISFPFWYLEEAKKFQINSYMGLKEIIISATVEEGGGVAYHYPEDHYASICGFVRVCVCGQQILSSRDDYFKLLAPLNW